MKFCPSCNTVRIGVLDIQVPYGVKYITVDMNCVIEGWFNKPTIDLGFWSGGESVVLGRIILEENETLSEKFKCIEVR